ncbi:MAG: LysM peptidoglycan-binding domain-containing protein [Anaerolineaceae bacterium]|nr:LysM peptidoglycan-binding domain-containing protein [Anaerolineaceae bacterium]
MKKWIVSLTLLVFLGALSACQTELNEPPRMMTATTVIYSATLEHPATKTPQAEEAEANSTPTLVPSPTPTPRTYEVLLNDTMNTIAYFFGITYDELQAANPEADPYALIVGQTLIIPATSEDDEQVSSLPTPSTLTLSEVRCVPDAADGLWCLLTARAPEDQGRENIAVEITLNGAGSNEAIQTIAFAPLNSLAVGERMPLAVYIDAQILNDAPFSPPYQARAELIQALPLNNTEGRYLDLALVQPVILISEDGRQAEVEVGLTQSESSTQNASRIWVLAAAYDAQDQLIGLRRWEATEPIAPDGTITVSLLVFSIDGTPIDHVELLFEARP